MFDFSTPDSVSAFDLHPHEENFIEPFKRPLSSMAPTLVLMNDWPRVAASASGGPRIITSVLQTLLRHLSQGTPLLLAAAGPRMHHQLRPDILEAESSSLLDRLAQSGVDLSSVGHWGLPEGAVSARVLGARYDEIAATSGLSDGPACDGCPRDAASGAGVLPGGSVGSLRVPDETGTFLSGLGHVVEWRERFAVCQAVSIEQDGSGILITAVSDPRKDGAPASAEHRGR